MRVQNITQPTGEVDLLIGYQSATIFPKVKATRGNLRLLESQFGLGLLLGGLHPKVKPTERVLCPEAHVMSCGVSRLPQRREKMSKAVSFSYITHTSYINFLETEEDCERSLPQAEVEAVTKKAALVKVAQVMAAKKTAKERSTGGDPGEERLTPLPVQHSNGPP